MAGTLIFIAEKQSNYNIDLFNGKLIEFCTRTKLSDLMGKLFRNIVAIPQRTQVTSAIVNTFMGYVCLVVYFEDDGGCCMEIKSLKNWSEFKPIVDEIRKTYGYHEFTIGEDQSIKFGNTILFRGQQSSKWKLETTLERKTQEEFTLRRYLYFATKSVNELESYTGQKWHIKDLPDLIEEVKKGGTQFRPHLPNYDYLVYLRHHGYPSPLLDWTESPYIAAYFAMCELSPDEEVAIYAYIETPIGAKSVDVGNAQISVQGPYVSADKRHFLQKAWYTIATRFSSENEEHIICSHHEVFEKSEKNQDVLIKITIPSTDRKVALRELNDFNINHFALFQSEDALIKALSIKDFDISA